MELNFAAVEMQKQNIPIDRAQRVDERNGVICLVTVFTPRFMVIKISKMVITCTCNPATLEAEFWNVVGSIPIRDNSPSIGRRIVLPPVI